MSNFNYRRSSLRTDFGIECWKRGRARGTTWPAGPREDGKSIGALLTERLYITLRNAMSSPEHAKAHTYRTPGYNKPAARSFGFN